MTFKGSVDKNLSEKIQMIKFVEMMVMSWPLTFLRQGQICTLIHLYVENVEKSFSWYVLKTNGWNLQFVNKEIKLYR